MNGPSLAHRVLVHLGHVFGRRGHPSEDLLALADVDDLAPLEEHRHAHLVPVPEKLADPSELCLEVVLPRLNRELDLFEAGCLLLFLLPLP